MNRASFICRVFLLGLMTAVSGSAWAGDNDGPVNVLVVPRDYSLQHQYLSLVVFPKNGDTAARVAFQQCEERSDPGDTVHVTPECRDLGRRDGYDAEDVAAEGNKGKPLFFAKIAGEAGAVIASSLTGGTVGMALGAVTGAANIGNDDALTDFRKRRTTKAIARAAGGAGELVPSNRGSHDLFDVAYRMVKDLERKRTKQDKLRANGAGPQVNMSPQKKVPAVQTAPQKDSVPSTAGVGEDRD